MKLAVICLVGPLDRFGYQNTYRVALESFSRFADAIYLISSTRNDANVDEVRAAYPNLVHISGPDTWYALDEKGDEIFDLEQWNRNLEVGRDRAIHDGMDAALLIAINTYVPEDAAQKILDKTDKMLKENRPYEWVYRRFQLGSALFMPDAGLPNILNLHIPEPYHYKYDWIETPKGTKIPISYGSFFPQFASEAVVDCPMEMSFDDLLAKINFTRNYSDIRENAPMEFDFQAHIEEYYVGKFLLKEISHDPLCRFGLEVARNHRADYVSEYILQKYRRKQDPILNYLRENFPGISSMIHRFKRSTARIKGTFQNRLPVNH